ncbi:hypothetical protein ACTJKC_15490 [Pedobacter sp. 22226]|uniref:hypothetical protein n=1 Tax=Pedobacter sp. 22226 TaxID=3453894 RepID=UPI003F84F934
MKKIFKNCLLMSALLMASQHLFAQDNPSRQPSEIGRPVTGEGYFAFYEGHNAQGTCDLLYGAFANVNLNLTSTHPGSNDRISSVALVGPISDQKLWIADNSSGNVNDDYATITVTGTLPAGTRVVIPSFQIGAAPGVFYNQNGCTVTLVYYPDFPSPNLDGKVSRIGRTQYN